MKLDKKQNRLRRIRAQGPLEDRELEVNRLSVHRTPRHIYAQIIAADGGTVLASASTLEKEVRKGVKNGGNVEAATIVGAAHCREGKVGRHRHGRIRSLRFSVSRPRQGPGRRGA